MAAAPFASYAVNSSYKAHTNLLAKASMHIKTSRVHVELRMALLRQCAFILKSFVLKLFVLQLLVPGIRIRTKLQELLCKTFIPLHTYHVQCSQLEPAPSIEFCPVLHKKLHDKLMSCPACKQCYRVRRTALCTADQVLCPRYPESCASHSPCCLTGLQLELDCHAGRRPNENLDTAVQTLDQVAHQLRLDVAIC